MVSRPLISVSLCLAAALHLAGATAQPDKINGLLNNSPFGQSRIGGPAAATGTGDPLEFRAVLGDNDNTMFSIYDTTAKRSVWVPLKDSSNGFAVNEYDATKESVTVDFRGRLMTLAIKRAPAVAVAPVARPNIPVAGGPIAPGNVIGPNQTVGPAPTAIDQQRMQQIQEEIRRRRALREQPAANTVQGAQTGPAQLPANNSTGPQVTPSNTTGPQPIPPRP